MVLPLSPFAWSLIGVVAVLGVGGCFPSLPPETPDGAADGAVDVDTQDLSTEDAGPDADVDVDAEVTLDAGADADGGEVTTPDCRELDGPCATGAFSAELGRCVAIFKDDDTPCDDADACTSETVCASGQCVGLAKECPPIDACHVAGRCEPATGECVPVVGPDGVACELDDPCAAEAECRAGVCRMTVAAVDEDDWVVPLPAGFDVGFVVPGEEAGSFTFAGTSIGDLSFGRDLQMSPGPVVAIVEAEPGSFRRFVGLTSSVLPGSVRSALRPWRSSEGAVIGLVDASISNQAALLTIGEESSVVSEFVSADTVRAAHVADARGSRFAAMIDHTGCLSWTDIAYDGGMPQAVEYQHCPSDLSARSVSVGLGDLGLLAFHENGLPMTAYRTVLSTPSEATSVPTVHGVRMLPGGALVTAIDYSGTLTLLDTTLGTTAVGAADCALIFLSRDAVPVSVINIGGIQAEKCGALTIDETGRVGVVVESSSNTVHVKAGVQTLENGVRASSPEAGGLIMVVVDASGNVELVSRVHALESDKPDIRVAGFDLLSAGGARMLVAVEDGQRVAWSSSDSPVVSTELGLVWAEVDADGGPRALRVVDEFPNPQWYDRADMYLGHASRLVDRAGRAGVFQSLATREWKVINSNDRMRCSVNADE